MSDESTRKRWSSGDAEFYVLNLGCVAESLVMVMNCWHAVLLKHTPNIDGQTRDRLGLVHGQTGSEEVQTEERETHGSDREVI